MSTILDSSIIKRGDPNTFPCLKLWTAVLEQAFHDKDWDWFFRKSEEPCSFLWICDVLELAPGLVRNKARSRMARLSRRQQRH